MNRFVPVPTADRIVIFDCDQTLIENSQMTPAWLEITDRRDLARRDVLDVWMRSAGRPMAMTAAETFAVPADDPLVAEVIEEFWEAVSEYEPQAVSGAGEVLSELDSRGIALYLSSASAPKPLTTWLRILDWERYFCLILGSDEEMVKGADHYSRILADTSLSHSDFCSRALTVGDAPYDMYYGAEQGVALRIGFAPDSERGRRLRPALIKSGANLLIDRLIDLIDIVEHPDPLSDPRWAVS